MNRAAALLVLMVGLLPFNIQAAGLIDALTGQLGVSTEQAMGGAGSIFSLAKQNLSLDDFASIAKVVPDMDSLLGAAPALGGSGAMGAASSLLGGSSSSLGGAAALAGSFDSLGLNSDMVGKFVPVVLDYVQGVGGEAAMNLLQKAIM